MKMETSPSLSPTLWRTCRILSGPTRLALIRRIIGKPGQCVSELAKAERLSWPRASQELRRLQSRGLVQVERTGRYVRYYPEADPLVSSAKPLLRALQEICARFPPEEDEGIAAMAKGLSHAKRLEIVRVLSQDSFGFPAWRARTRMPTATLWRHLGILEEAGWIRRNGRTWKLAANETPLAKCLLKLL